VFTTYSILESLNLVETFLLAGANGQCYFCDKNQRLVHNVDKARSKYGSLRKNDNSNGSSKLVGAAFVPLTNYCLILTNEALLFVPYFTMHVFGLVLLSLWSFFVKCYSVNMCDCHYITFELFRVV